MNENYKSIVDRVNRKMSVDREIENQYSNFLFGYFNQTNKRELKITNLTLFLNKLPPNIEHLWVAKTDFVEIKKTKKELRNI